MLSHDVAVMTATSFLSVSRHHGQLHSFPTRRSSDLFEASSPDVSRQTARRRHPLAAILPVTLDRRGCLLLDRKSTRLNSSHEWISYAVFCLKKKISCLLNCYHLDDEL